MPISKKRTQDASGTTSVSAPNQRPRRMTRSKTRDVAAKALMSQTDLVTSAISYLPFREQLDSAALSRSFLVDICPRVPIPADFRLRIDLMGLEEIGGRFQHLGRFRGATSVIIKCKNTVVSGENGDVLNYTVGKENTMKILGQTILGLKSEHLKNLEVCYLYDDYVSRDGEPRTPDDERKATEEWQNAIIPLQKTLKTLKLTHCHLHPDLLLPPLLNLENLTRLEIEITPTMWTSYDSESRSPWVDIDHCSREKILSFGRPFEVLSELPNLTELALKTNDEAWAWIVYCQDERRPTIRCGIMLGLSKLRKLKVLEMDDGIMQLMERSKEIFNNMLAGMESIEVLPLLITPRADFWRVVKAKGAGKCLKRLNIVFCDDCENDDIEVLVKIILEQFTQIETIRLELDNQRNIRTPDGFDRPLNSIARLRHHPSLRKISFRINCSGRPPQGVDWKSGPSRLQKLVGGRIKVFSIVYRHEY